MKEKHCSLTSEWRRCVYDPGRCRKCRAAKIRARIAHLRSGLPLAEYQCPYFERAGAPGEWTEKETREAERAARELAAVVIDATPTAAELVELEKAMAELGPIKVQE